MVHVIFLNKQKFMVHVIMLVFLKKKSKGFQFMSQVQCQIQLLTCPAQYVMWSKENLTRKYFFLLFFLQTRKSF